MRKCAGKQAKLKLNFCLILKKNSHQNKSHLKNSLVLAEFSCPLWLVAAVLLSTNNVVNGSFLANKGTRDMTLLVESLSPFCAGKLQSL